MPVPLITVLQNGKGFLGKQQLIKEFILVPTPGFPLQKVIMFKYAQGFLFLSIFYLFSLFLLLKQIEVISHVNRSIRDSLYQSKTQPGVS